MTIEALDRAYKAQPFRPFAFGLANGRTLPVPHPEHLAFSQKSRTAVIMDDGRFEVIDLLLVVSLSLEGQETAKS